LGDFYDFHSDILHTGPHYRKMSFSLQLSDPSTYKGSELEFYHYGNTFDKSKTDQGTLIAFPSFIPHRVTPLTEGKRYSLVGWVCGKAFK
jgi:PKHD-type hydroxylase